MGDMTPNEDYNLNAPDGSTINLRDLFDLAATGRLSQTSLDARYVEASELVNVLDYGADKTGVASSKTAIQAALAAAGNGGTIYFPPGNYKCNNLTISQAIKIASFKATLYKDGNGPVLILDAADIDCDIRIRGEGATYTGVGVEIQDAPDYRWRGQILDTESYCIDHTTNDSSHRGAIAGPVLLQSRGGAAASIRMPPNELTTSGARTITNVFTGGAPLVDLAGGTMTYVLGCNFTTIITGALSKSALIVANRLASANTVHGTNILFVANEMGGALTLDTDCSQAVVIGNRIVGGVIDNGTNNTVVGDRVTVTDIQPYTVDPRQLATPTILTANQRIYQRITTGQGTITKIGLHVVTSSGNINLAVYGPLASAHGSTARPGTRRADSGSVPCPAAGYAEIALGSTVNVTTQDWFSIVSDNGIASLYRAGAHGTTSAVARGIAAFENAAFAAPATATPSASAIFSIVLVGVV